jgi:hypothetical protein
MSQRLHLFDEHTNLLTAITYIMDVLSWCFHDTCEEARSASEVTIDRFLNRALAIPSLQAHDSIHDELYAGNGEKPESVPCTIRTLTSDQAQRRAPISSSSGHGASHMQLPAAILMILRTLSNIPNTSRDSPSRSRTFPTLSYEVAVQLLHGLGNRDSGHSYIMLHRPNQYRHSLSVTCITDRPPHIMMLLSLHLQYGLFSQRHAALIMISGATFLIKCHDPSHIPYNVLQSVLAH